MGLTFLKIEILNKATFITIYVKMSSELFLNLKINQIILQKSKKRVGYRM